MIVLHTPVPIEQGALLGRGGGAHPSPDTTNRSKLRSLGILLNAESLLAFVPRLTLSPVMLATSPAHLAVPSV